jgi:hypothetical protein
MAEDNPLIEGAKNLESKFENVVNKIPTMDTVKQAYSKYKVGGAASKAATEKPAAPKSSTARKRVAAKR